jgi:hypothetical protein
MSKWADVYWNAESSLVAIDEYPWNRGGGQITILALGNGGASARKVPIPRKAILARSGQRWDTSRLRIDERTGWATPQRLCLSLAGQTFLNESAPRRYGYSHFEVWIEITRDLQVRVLSIKPATG